MYSFFTINLPGLLYHFNGFFVLPLYASPSRWHKTPKAEISQYITYKNVCKNVYARECVTESERRVWVMSEKS